MQGPMSLPKFVSQEYLKCDISEPPTNPCKLRNILEAQEAAHFGVTPNRKKNK